MSNLSATSRILPSDVWKLHQEGLVRLVQAPVPHLPHLFTIDASVAVRRDEDALYASRPDLHRALPRGLCFVVDVEANKIVCTLAGLRKFTYDEGLTDTQRDKELVAWVFSDKANGETCHVAAFHDRIAGLCMVSGSKNVHGVFRVATRELLDQDIRAYAKEKRYSFTVAMVRHLADTKFDALTTRVLPDLTKSGQTLCLESCRTDSLHLVHYETSQAFAFALTDYQCAWTCCDPMALVAQTRTWGIDAVPDVHVIDVRDKDGDAAARKHFYERPNSEGAVVYALDVQRRVMSVFKFKNFDYMFFRSVREKLRGRGCSSQQLVARLSYPPYHALHPHGLAAHNALIREALEFRAFYRITQAETQEKQTVDEAAEEDRENDWDVSSQWVGLRHAFGKLSVEERADFCKRNAHVEAEQERCAYEAEEAAAALASNGKQVQVFFVAPPGSGKSTIGRGLVYLVGQAGHTATYLDQDMCGGAGAYHAAAKKTTTMPVISQNEKEDEEEQKQEPAPSRRKRSSRPRSCRRSSIWSCLPSATGRCRFATICVAPSSASAWCMSSCIIRTTRCRMGFARAARLCGARTCATSALHMLPRAGRIISPCRPIRPTCRASWLIMSPPLRCSSRVSCAWPTPPGPPLCWLMSRRPSLPKSSCAKSPMQ
jgi:hypothetical protein